jgi:hypothetical protein
MKVFFISILSVFFVFWAIFFTVKIQKDDFYACPAFNEIDYIYKNDIYKDIPFELKQEVMDNYKDTGLLKIKKCSMPKDFKGLGVLNITRNTESLSYVSHKFLFDYFNSEESKKNIKDKVFFEDSNVFSHSFYFDKSFSTIIESFQQNIHDIHILNPDYYMDIRLMNNIDNSPFSILTNRNFINDNVFLNIQMFYTSLAVDNVIYTTNKLSNISFEKEFNVVVENNKVYNYENKNTKIRSTTFKLNEVEDFSFIVLYIKNNFNIDISKSMSYLKNNLNLNLGFNDEKIIVEVFHSQENNSFSIDFLYY